jgi:hypothetical protein
MNTSRAGLVCVLLALVVGGCRDAAPPPVEKPAPSPPRRPVALFGTWLRNPPFDVRHDTLVLRPDSTATGWTRWADDTTSVVAIAHWSLKFLSKDPAVSRTDMPGRYQDGGDARCSFTPDSTCVSAPTLCLVPDGRKGFCQGMTFRGDTLWLSTDGRYVRIARLDGIDSVKSGDVDSVPPRSTSR